MNERDARIVALKLAVDRLKHLPTSSRNATDMANEFYQYIWNGKVNR